jgi:hypothetical protein
MDIVERLRREASKHDMLACEDMLQAADEIERLRAEHEWRPIKTAPKGGMFIYYWLRDRKRAVGLAYLANDGHWRDSEGNWEKRIEPTHWMPLPAPPEDN